MNTSTKVQNSICNLNSLFKNQKVIVGIYKITNPKGCIYIGQSINIKRRLNEYKKHNGCGTNTKLLNSLKKYGFASHKIEIVQQCEKEKLNELEIFYIDLFQSFNREKGMNLHSGGNNHVISDETREKLRKSHLGQVAWNKGLTKNTDERLKKQGLNHSLKMIGRKASDETKLKMGLSRKGKKHTPETIKILSNLKIGNKVWLGRNHTEESKEKMRKPKPKKNE